MKDLKVSIIVIPFVLLFISNPLLSQDTIVLQPGAIDGKDAMVRSLLPLKNWGDNESMFAAAWTYDGDFGITRPVFNFDLSLIPDSSEIMYASLSLFYDPSCGHEGHSGPNESYLYRITNSWDENIVNWSNQPSYTTQNQVFFPASYSSTQDYIDIDVTNLVLDMINDPENSFGFILRHVNELEYRSLIFASSDHPNENFHPKLVIVFRCITSISSNYKAHNISFYPNPGNGLMHISFSDIRHDKVLIELISYTGKSLFKKEFATFSNNQELELDLSKYNSGIYFVRLSNKSFQKTQKIVIQ